MTDVHAELHAEFERAALLEGLPAVGAAPDQLARAALVPLPGLRERARW